MLYGTFETGSISVLLSEIIEKQSQYIGYKLYVSLSPVEYKSMDRGLEVKMLLLCENI